MPVTISGTTGITGPDGSASTPSLAGADTNTGIFFPAADTIAFAEGGAEVARFDSSGNLGIGTSSPSTYANSQAPVLVVGTGNNFATVQGRTDGPSGATNGVAFGGSYSTNAINGSRITLNAEGSAGQRGSISFWTKPTDDNTNQPTERARIDQSGNAMWNGTNTDTSNGNAGYIYKFFGGSNNVILPLESSGSNRFAIFEYRRTGRSNARTSQISIGENASSQGEVQVYSSAANAALSGGVVLANGATSWSAISDINKKVIIEPIENASEKVSTLRAVIGRYKTDEEDVRRTFLIAQDVQAVLPEAVAPISDVDGSIALGLSYTDTIPLLVAAIQEQQALITALTARIEALEAK